MRSKVRDVLDRRVTLTWSLEEVVEKYPEAVGILMDKGVVCMICGEPVWGTVGDLIKDKGLDIKVTLDEINKELEKSS